MPLKKKTNKWKITLISLGVLVLLGLMFLSFGTTQHLTEVVLYPN